MMDKTYILEHGILEQYALGELSDSDQQHVEALLRDDAELRQMLYDIELSFEKMAFENAMEVSPDVKTRLMQKVRKSTTRTLTEAQLRPNRSYLAVASSIAALLFIGSVYLYMQLQDVQEELQIVSDQKKDLNDQIEELNTSLAETAKWYATINDPDTEKYVLRGNTSMPDATVIGYVNDAKKMVVINTQQLPDLDQDHDYQMWADVEGVMINMGVIDDRQDMVAMTYIDNAESLNITIEPAGGSDHPTVSKLVTNVYLK